MTKSSAARVTEPAFDPIARETLQERVYRALRKALMLGRFAPGQALTVQELAVRFNTSAMPVREALARLVSEQALETASNRSVRVAPLDAARLADVAQARRLVEGAALELAAPRLTPADLSALTRANEAHARIDHRRGPLAVDALIEANFAFHFLIYNACGSPAILRIVEGLWLQSGALVRSAVEQLKPDDRSPAHFHTRIVDALALRDVAAAKAALADDIGRAFALVSARLAEA